MSRSVDTCLVGTLTVGLILAACAGVKNTPEQNYVYAMARQGNCEARGVTLHQVWPDGRYEARGSGGAATLPEFFACMDAAMKARPFVAEQWI
jgi:hypothetical protein